MNVLEKILEEIENESKLAHEEMRRCASENPLQFDEVKGYARGVEYVAEIIRYHMNEVDDGWIPVEERLPKKPVFGENSYIVQHKCITTPYSAYWDGENWTEDYSDEPIRGIIAWQPLPKQYKMKEK